jgi:excinuclease UvrABC ATPase subunit
MVDPYRCLQYLSKLDRPNFSKIPSLTSVTKYCDTDTHTNSTSSCNVHQQLYMYVRLLAAHSGAQTPTGKEVRTSTLR